MADYYRYKAEYAYGEARENSTQSASNLYEAANTLAENALLPINPLRLHLAINRSAFYFEVQNFPYHAYRVCQKAVDDARYCATRPQTKVQCQEYNTLMSMLSDNIRIYQVEIVRRLHQARRYVFDYLQEEEIIDRLRRRGLVVNINYINAQ